MKGISQVIHFTSPFRRRKTWSIAVWDVPSTGHQTSRLPGHPAFETLKITNAQLFHAPNKPAKISGQKQVEVMCAVPGNPSSRIQIASSPSIFAEKKIGPHGVVTNRINPNNVQLRVDESLKIYRTYHKFSHSLKSPAFWSEPQKPPRHINAPHLHDHQDLSQFHRLKSRGL